MLSLIFIYIYSASALPIYSQNVSRTPYGWKGEYRLNSGKGPYGPDSSRLELEMHYQTNNRLHIKISDPSHRYYPVREVIKVKEVTKAAQYPEYTVAFAPEGGFRITRSRTGSVLFDTAGAKYSAPLISEQHFVQIGTTIPKNPIIFGLGMRATEFSLPYPRTYVINNVDKGTPHGGDNHYGSQPFYIQRSEDGFFHGVLFCNLAPQAVEIDNGTLTWRSMGGPIDIYIMVGLTVKDVVKQYTELVGRPCLQPQWVYGFHQCRWGWSSLEHVKGVVNNFTANHIPLDVMWGDIDYMDQQLLFTTDPEFYPKDDYAQWIADLKKDNVRYVMITDPGIGRTPDGMEYPPYEELLENGLFLRNRTGHPYHGAVWPGRTLFPDFFRPEVHEFWSRHMTKFYDEMHLDGCWLDMNEIANFCDGYCRKSDEAYYDPTIDEEDPIEATYPWMPHNLSDHACPPDIQTSIGPYYLVHNMYALFNNKVTKEVLLEKHPNQRPFLLSRATCPGSGYVGGMWLGDNYQTFESLRDSISSVTTAGILGLAFCGCDVGGFSSSHKTLDKELLVRWHAMGAFLYPFYRNHNCLGEIDHEPYRVDETNMTTIIKFIKERQKIQTYIYTLMHEAHDTGIPLTRPLCMEFWRDPKTMNINTQAMLGSALLISPVVDPNVTKTTDCYIPFGRWYDYWTEEEYHPSPASPRQVAQEALEAAQLHANEEVTLETLMANGAQTGSLPGTAGQSFDAPLDYLPVHIRGGEIFTKQAQTGTRTAEMLESPITVVVPIGLVEPATGEIVVDDGIYMDDNEDNPNRLKVKFSYGNNTLTATIPEAKFATTQKIEEIRILGYDSTAETFEVAFDPPREFKMDYDPAKKLFVVSVLNNQEIPEDWQLDKPFTMTITPKP